MEETHKRQIQWLAVAAGMIAVIVIIMVSFSTKIKREGKAYYADQMSDMAQERAGEIYTELQLVQKAGETAAQMLMEKNITENGDILAAIKAVFQSTEAYRVVYYDHKEKDSFSYEGEDFSKIKLGDCTYYDMILAAEETEYFYLSDDEINSMEAILLVIPLSQESARGLLIYYPTNGINTILRISTGEYGYNSFAVLVSAAGEVVAQGNYDGSFFKKEDFWSNISEKYSDNVEQAEVQIASQVPGSVEVATKQTNEEKTLFYAPVGINGWSVIVGLNQSYVNKKVSSYEKTNGAMLWQLLMVLLCFFAIYLVLNYISKRRIEENRKLLKEKADTDLLTGLTNKIATENKIKEYMEENPDTLAMMFLLDIDNFKKINDTMGHAFGDEVLKTLGSTIGSIFRVTDIIGRTGGDEFTVFLKFLKTDENTLKEAEKLVQFFKDFTAGEYVKYSATASIGAAVYPTHGRDYETLYKAADQALYKAKKRGKNQLAFYDDRDRAGKEEPSEEEQS